MKRKWLRWTLWLLTLLCMAFIFYMSAQTADASSKLSGGILSRLARVFVPSFESWDALRQENWVSGWQFFIRKGAHFSIYALLGALLLFALSTHALQPRSRKVLSFGIGVLYAVFDELHQRFVPGRSCEMRDVLLDAAGVIFGIFVAYAFLWGVRKIKKRRAKNMHTQ